MTTPPPPFGPIYPSLWKRIALRIRSDWLGLPSETLDVERGRLVLWGVGIVAVCALTTGQSFLRFGDSGTMLGVSLLAGLFALLFNAVYVLPGWTRRFFLVGSILALIACAVALVLQFKPMIERANANDKRCEKLQEQMLALHPTMSSAPEVFRALGCDPSGTDPRIMIP